MRPAGGCAHRPDLIKHGRRRPLLSEAALYPAIKRFLAARGYAAKGEVEGCDVAAVRVDSANGNQPLLVIAELKLGFTLDLVLQGVERAGVADQVWLAVRATRRGRDRDRRTRALCGMLGFGLLAVHPGPGTVEVLAEPGPWRPRTNQRRRRAVLAEHAARHGDPSPGGTRAVPVMTAYRQEALACAAALQAGPLRPRDLKPAAPRAAAILQRDVYGWFTRLSRGIYALAPAGAAALVRWYGAVDASASRPDPDAVDVPVPLPTRP